MPMRSFAGSLAKAMLQETMADSISFRCSAQRAERLNARACSQSIVLILSSEAWPEVFRFQSLSGAEMAARTKTKSKRSRQVNRQSRIRRFKNGLSNLQANRFNRPSIRGFWKSSVENQEEFQEEREGQQKTGGRGRGREEGERGR